MIVFFRACEANKTAGSLADSDNPYRYAKFTKEQILKASWLSLQHGLTENDTTYVMADRVSKETLNWFKETCSSNFHVIELPAMSWVPPTGEHPYPRYHPVKINHAIPFFEEFYDILQTTSDEELIYICEDDYIHIPQAIDNMKATFANYVGFLIPYDYPDRYYLDRDRNCSLILGSRGHLRSVPSATLTMAANAKVWKYFKIDVLRGSVFADDSWTWKAFQIANAYSPVPGWATHLQDNCITPYIDWVSLTEEYLKDVTIHSA
jgi:hypothetical protein